jgi:hypothetical protein
MNEVLVEILKPEAESILGEMENNKLVKLSKPGEKEKEKKPLQFGSMKGLVLYIADDFDAPLDDFEEYM